MNQAGVRKRNRDHTYLIRTMLGDHLQNFQSQNYRAFYELIFLREDMYASGREFLDMDERV